MAATDADADALADQLLGMVTDCWRTQAIYAFASLGIADLLADGNRKSVDMAEELGLHPGALEQLLNGSVTLGLAEQTEDDNFRLTSMGRLLSEDEPGSIKYWSMWWGLNLWPLWGSLAESVRTGESARKLLAGTEGFQHIQNNPKSATIFNRGLAEVTRMAARSIVRAFDFGKFDCILDVGGGHGQLLGEVLLRCPNARGVLLELPHAIAGAQAYLSAVGVESRVECIAGDFFEQIPAGEAIVLKSVLHDWKDEDALRILACCREAMKPDSTLLLIERLMPESLTTSRDHQVLARGDLTMLIAHGAGERSEKEFKDLLAKSGLSLQETVPTSSGFSLLVSHLDHSFAL
jgi:orsellinic acid C2-O-methyltransferase